VPSPLSSAKISALPLVKTTVETDAPLFCTQNTNISITGTRGSWEDEYQINK